MSNFPPEKYYEACITYHLVNEFEVLFQRKIYPFSISQIEENSKGYDYGYTYSEKSFYIQFKRPFAYDSATSTYNWQICRNQLGVINQQNYRLNTYYALPAFVDSMKWFEGLEYTFFVLAPNLESYLKNKNTAKTNLVNSDVNILKSWSYFSSKYSSVSKNVAYKTEQKPVTFTDIVIYAQSLNKETRECTWVYLIKEEE